MTETAKNDAEREAQIRRDCERFDGIGTEEVRFLLSALDDARARLNATEGALHPFGEYAVCRDAQPLRGLDDVIHAIHTGTPWQSEIRLSDCRRAAALLGYTARSRSPVAVRETTDNG